MPTGMKAGVSSGPCGVTNRPRRAAVVGSVARSSKENAEMLMPSILAGQRIRKAQTHEATTMKAFSLGEKVAAYSPTDEGR